MSNMLIVSRHPATVEFIRKWKLLDGVARWADAPVIDHATYADVEGKIVAGNIPAGIAAGCAEWWAMEFGYGLDDELPPPRGNEYTIEQLKAANAHLLRYMVVPLYHGSPELATAIKAVVDCVSTTNEDSYASGCHAGRHE